MVDCHARCHNTVATVFPRTVTVAEMGTGADSTRRRQDLVGQHQLEVGLVALELCLVAQQQAGGVHIADTILILMKPIVRIVRRHLLSHLRNNATASKEHLATALKVKAAIVGVAEIPSAPGDHAGLGRPPPW